MKLKESHEARQFVEGYTYFWRKKNKSSRPPFKESDYPYYTKPRRFDKFILSDLLGKIKVLNGGGENSPVKPFPENRRFL